MSRFLNRSHPASAVSPAHAGPDPWHDLKRDWRRWSRAERLAAECALGLIVICGAAALAATTLV